MRAVVFVSAMLSKVGVGERIVGQHPSCNGEEGREGAAGRAGEMLIASEPTAMTCGCAMLASSAAEGGSR